LSNTRPQAAVVRGLVVLHGQVSDNP